MKKLSRAAAWPAVAAILAVGAMVASGASRPAERAVAQAPPPGDVEAQIDGWLARMSLEEKLGQLQQLDADFPTGELKPEQVELVRQGRLGSALNARGAKATNAAQRIQLDESPLKIPLLFGFDVIHGYRTVFPVPLAEASSFDPADAEKSAAIAAKEARAAGVHWTFAPMVDIARDPRWGRIVEGAGEDVYLGARFAGARVRGFQGADYSAPDRVAATAKHWVAYGGAEAGRDYNTVDASERKLRELYFPPFKAAVDNGVASFMTSFNDLNGVPATANRWILRDVLRDEWGFDGPTLSDYTAVQELIAHGVAADGADAARQALNAGTDMEMVSKHYVEHGKALVDSGAVSMATIDEAVRRVLRLKYRLGLFERPYVDEAAEQDVLLTPEHLAEARRIAGRSMVLLENRDKALPLKGDRLDRVAVVGPLANSKVDMLGTWIGDGKVDDAVTVVDGMEEALPDARIRYARGCTAACTSKLGFSGAVREARRADVTVVVVGEQWDQSGEASSRADISLPGKQLELVQAIHATGRPYVVVLVNGRPLTIPWLAENAPALLEAWYPGTQAGHAVADVLLGKVNPGGKLPVTFPRSVGQIPLYYDAKSTGRPFDANNKYTSKYLDSPNTPQYPFGFGLSYTTFTLTDPAIEPGTIAADGTATVKTTVRNTGDRRGDQVVQLYVRDKVASVTRPVRMLRGFQRVTLDPGESRELTLELGPAELGLLDQELKPTVEPGEFDVWVSDSSQGGRQGTLTVSG